MLSDLRLSLATLLRNPGFTAAAVIMLALGIGVNATVFTVADAVLFKGFPQVERNDRLLYISNGGCCISYPDFEDIRSQAKGFQGFGITHGIARVLSDSSGFPERVEITEVSAGTFALTGRHAILGRDFTAADQVPGSASVAILNYGYWQRRFGRDPGVIGRTVRTNGQPTTIVGVMPEGYSFPQTVDMWVPLVETAAVKNRNNTDTWFAFGRLADGVSPQAGRAELEGIITRLETEYPVSDQRIHLVVQTFPQFFIGSNAAMIYGSMWVAVGFVLLIACANLANLLLARAMRRAREISVRMALGAGRWRIIRQLLVESLLLSGGGGFLGWWLAQWGVRTYSAAMASKTSWLILDYTMDHRVLAYLIAISIGTGILFGLAPALRLSRLDLNAALKDGGRGSTVGGRGKHLSAALVTGEMALAVILLAGAGVMIRSFLKIETANLGVNASNVLAGSVDLPPARYPSPQQRVDFFDQLKARVQALPGVESVTLAETLPSWGGRRVAYELAGASGAVPTERLPKMLTIKVGAGYFHALEAKVLSGREFNDSDVLSAAPAAMVNQLFAEQHWPGEIALGKRLRFVDAKGPQEWLTVVGVVSNIIQGDMNRQRVDPVVYTSYRQQPGGGMWVLARTAVPPVNLATALRRQVQELDADLPLYGPFTMTERMARFVDSRFYGALFLIFAVIALLLASVGLYTVVAHAVSARTQEIGVRMAVGASAQDILKLVLMQGLVPLGVGLGVGLAGSLAVNRALQSELIAVSPSDPVTLIASSLVLVLAAALGCLVPAYRAMRVDPMIALRNE